MNNGGVAVNCPKCQAKVVEDGRFCGECGANLTALQMEETEVLLPRQQVSYSPPQAPISAPVDPQAPPRKKRKWLIPVLCGILGIALGVGAFFFLQNREDIESPAYLLSLGNRFLLELDYEQALVQFLRVIEIEPMNPRGYEGAARAYIGLERYDDAADILQTGVELTQDDTLREMLVDVQVILTQRERLATENGASTFEPAPAAPAPQAPAQPQDDIGLIAGSWRRDNPDSGWYNVVVDVFRDGADIVGVVSSATGTGVAVYGVSSGDIKWRNFVRTSENSYTLMDFWLLHGGAWIEMYAYINPMNPDVLHLNRTDGITAAHGYSQRWVRVGQTPGPGAPAPASPAASASIPVAPNEDSLNREFVLNVDGILYQAAVAQINGLSRNQYRQNRTSVYVIAVRTAHGEDLEAFSDRMFEQYQLEESSVLIVFSTEENSFFITPGHHVEHFLPSALGARLINEIIGPPFDLGDFDRAAINGVRAILPYLQAYVPPTA